MAKPTKPIHISLRIPLELKQALDQRAEEDRRSVSSVVEIAIEEYVGVKPARVDADKRSARR